MLVELRVSQLGVIEDLAVVIGPGMTALTGETGAGKTLLVDAIELLLGAPASASAVRPGGDEALVEGRFETAEHSELVVTRVVPASGRSRAYVDGRMASSAQLADLGGAMVDLHGQHAHQSLLDAGVQRAALDLLGGISTDDLVSARSAVRDLRAARAELGGDPRSRAREIDLLRFQLEEIDAAKVSGPDEDDLLREEEERLGDAAGLRDSATAMWEGLAGEGAAVDRLAALVGMLAGKRPLEDLRERLVSAESELTELARDARRAAETIEDDPARLDEVGARRRLLGDLRRKYGETLADVLAYAVDARQRMEALVEHDARAADVDVRLVATTEALADAESRLLAARRAAAPGLARSVEGWLRQLAMPSARFEVAVEDGPGGGAVTWLLGANPGEPVLPLAKVASGGELARTMLAVRLVLGERRREIPAETGATATPDRATLVFDEVDAGIGGEAAVAVGRALATLGAEHQVLVVTHLPQVAAFADHHLVARKQVRKGRTIASVVAVDGDERVTELSRMLSGSPQSDTARSHAAELLEQARAGARGRRRAARGT